MSTETSSNSNSEKRKVQISFMIKMPVELELELSMPPTYQHLEAKKLTTSNQTEGSDSVVLMSENGKLKSEDVQVLSNQIIEQLLYTYQALFDSSHIQPTQNNLDNPQDHATSTEYFSLDNSLLEKEVSTQNFQVAIAQKRSGRLLDILNDSFTFSINTLGTIFFIGKVANYSWE